MSRHLEDISLGYDTLVVPTRAQRFHLEPSPRRVRVVFGGATIAESTGVMLLREAGRLPVCYFPWSDVRADLLTRSEHIVTSDLKGLATYYHVRVGERTAENAAWSYEAPPPEGGPDLRGYGAFYWSAMDEVFEEDERAYAHARDPYKLIDTRHSSRHVRVVLAGTTLAETHRPTLLFETGLPVRYYIPLDDLRMDVLEPSDTQSQCAYKGVAAYWSARIGGRLYPDVAWYYREPLALVTPIAGLAAFFQERVDAIEVDGQTVERPRTPWSTT
jgi:uncharacterized protein (DUF427 family)